MSKQIDYTQPLSAEDKAWAVQFHGLHGGMVKANEEAFPQEAGSDLSGEDPEDVPPYTEWSKKDLEAETKRRNNEEATTLKTSGTVAELAKQLEDDDAARAV